MSLQKCMYLSQVLQGRMPLTVPVQQYIPYRTQLYASLVKVDGWARLFYLYGLSDLTPFPVTLRGECSGVERVHLAVTCGEVSSCGWLIQSPFSLKKAPQRVSKYLILSIKVHILMINSENTIHINLFCYEIWRFLDMVDFVTSLHATFGRKLAKLRRSVKDAFSSSLAVCFFTNYVLKTFLLTLKYKIFEIKNGRHVIQLIVVYQWTKFKSIAQCG